MSQKYWINTQWLKALHLPMPTTTQQFEQMLVDFKTKHPDGVKNPIPLTGDVDGWQGNFIGFLMSAFVYDSGQNGPKQFTVMNHGRVEFAATTPQWKQGLEYIHQLYAKGLIDPGALTQSQNVVIQEVAQHRVGVFAAGANNNILNDSPPHTYYKVWQALPPLKGPGGLRTAVWMQDYVDDTAAFAITNKATKAQQIAAIKLANFAYTRLGTEMEVYGPEGKYWHYAKKGLKGLNGKQAVFVSSNAVLEPSTETNLIWGQNGLYNQNLNIQWSAQNPLSYQGEQLFLYLQSKKYYRPYLPPLKDVYPMWYWIPPAKAQQFASLETQINDYVNSNTAELITGAESIQSGWKGYVQGVKNLGLNQYLGILQDAVHK